MSLRGANPLIEGSSIPIEQPTRKSTDVVCTIVSAIFALALFITACVLYSSSGLNNAYFTWSATTTQTSTDYFGFQTAFWATVLTAFGLGIIWLSFVHLLPRYAPQAAFILAILSLIALGIVVLTAGNNFFNSSTGWKITVAVFCFVLAIILFVMFWLYRNSLKIQGIFLDYGRQFLHEVKSAWAYLFIFFIFLTGFITLIVFQHLAFSSRSANNNNYWDFSNPGVLGVLNILEFIWGLQFLKDAFNFCVSGTAANWYWANGPQIWYRPFVRLFSNHWGSVVAGSFLNAFFEVPTLLVELVTCHRNTGFENAAPFCEDKCPWHYFFGLVRTDAYSYINLSGLDFCNAGRNCYTLCGNSQLFVGFYNTIKHYRFAATIFLTTLGYLLGQIFANLRVQHLTWWHNVILVVIVYSVITWFVNITADAAEGILTSFLQENANSKGNIEEMQNVRSNYRDDITDSKRRQTHQDGRC